MHRNRTPHRPRAAALAALCSAACAAVALAPAAPAAADTAPSAAGWHTLAAGAAPSSNPLEGFIPYAGDYSTFPYSTEWFYLPLNAVMSAPDTFDWSAIDAQLKAIAARGHQAAVRFYLDYPDKPSGIPQYLLDEGLQTHSYDDYGNNGLSVSPNYDDPNLDTAIDQFIAAFGARYDGDARIGFVELGLLGFWGEWHTYPYNGDAEPENWFASPAEQQRVMTDYVNAFTRTKLLVRYPSADNASLPIGYHDDSFALETMASSTGWHFMDLMNQAGATRKWRTEPVAGELRPELQSCIFDVPADCPVIEDGGDNDFPGSVTQTHASWLLDQYAFDPGYTGAAYTQALAGSESLGYRLQVTSAETPRTARGTLTVGAAIRDTGIAPFYYDWPVQVAAVDVHGEVARTWTTDWKLTGVEPGDPASRFTAELAARGLAPGRYTLVLRAENPLPDGVALRFADRDQDATLDGWLTLGSTTVLP